MQLSEQAFQTPFPPSLRRLPPFPLPGPAPPPFCGGREHPSRKVIYGGKALRTDRLRVRKPAQESQSGATEESENPAVTPSCVPELVRGGGTRPAWPSAGWTQAPAAAWAPGAAGVIPTDIRGLFPMSPPWINEVMNRGCGFSAWSTSAPSRGAVSH